MKKIGWFFLLLTLSGPAAALCFQAAGLRYQVDPLLLKAMAIQESGLNPRAINHNKNKAGKVLSTDFGLMQINSLHIPTLKTLGVIRSKEDLLSNACLNVQIGAWILARHLNMCGYHWSCLGSYNAGFAKNNQHRRIKYARQVYRRYQQLRSQRQHP
ncbi:lytic transglycosylase (plasmid) [Candidatus Williamhamiltonella defendens]|uniref:Lytic transglycosylase n=1 Tax=Candidatus Williamhamiltonella defendens TaxID=138072 RepID=A0A2D3TAP3_9ENTR|nr:lytic transglycosylase domain-containing protein [Candidatus Hamiltonella defensa]ATW30910.1 lytic transglycosylase [Candidatus Hamiltonella defensa]ATW32858.1 lytic transglycosylase [Candidatus Hamiltonella defensa]